MAVAATPLLVSDLFAQPGHWIEHAPDWTTLQNSIKKMSGMFFVFAMTEKTSYRGRIPVFLFFSGCIHPGQNFSS
jgi:hypothetical protein